MASDPKAPKDGEGTVVLNATLQKVVYASESSGWAVVRLAVRDLAEVVTAVGFLVGLQPGVGLRLQGRWVTDAKYGRQFKVESHMPLLPDTVVGIERYLGSGLVNSVGKVMAGRIVKRFGLKTMDIIDTEPQKLTEVEGIGPVRAKKIKEAWDEQKGMREIMVFLRSQEVSTALGLRIIRQYGSRATEVVRADPYRLAREVNGIGFLTADRIAGNMGIPKDSPQRIEAGAIHVLHAAMEEGHVFAPITRLVEAARAILEIEDADIVGAVDRLKARGILVGEAVDGEEAAYLKALHVAEVGAARGVQRLLSKPATAVRIHVDRAIEWYQSSLSFALAPAQAQAIRRAIEAKVLVITGGPGTGKTTLVRGIIQILERKSRRILLAAPTGRAAKRLQETTGRPASTIHRLLEFRPKTMDFGKNNDHPLEADMVIIDEASMMDIHVSRHLLEALPAPCQLILVGDVDQLPSVGPGNVLRDLIDSKSVEVIGLNEIFRQSHDSLIVVNAHRINQGEMPLMGNSKEGDFFFLERDDPEAILQLMVGLMTERMKSFDLDPFEDIQVLTPKLKGLLGASNLNTSIQGALNGEGPALSRGSTLFRKRDRVMQVRNNYDLEVFNGDVGQVVAVEEGRLDVLFDERTVTYEKDALDDLTLAYACSIHKSQGSEYPAVIIPFHTQHYIMLQRNLLYTAITRGKRVVVIIGSRAALAMAVGNNQLSERYSGLKWRLGSP